MPEINDTELVTKLIERTQQGKVDWHPTSTKLQYTASFGGNYTVIVDKDFQQDKFWLSIQNEEGVAIHQIFGSQDYRIPELFFAARRKALNVDQAITDILKDLGE